MCVLCLSVVCVVFVNCLFAFLFGVFLGVCMYAMCCCLCACACCCVCFLVLRVSIVVCLLV